MQETPNIPDGYKDALHTDIEIGFGWLDRLKLLLGYHTLVRLVIFTEVVQGGVKSESKAHVFRPWRWPWYKPVFYVAIEPRSSHGKAT